MEIRSNISTVFGELASRISQLGNPDGMLREIATSMHPVVRDRIHTEGIAADGSQIGTYTKGYMSVRTGVYKSNSTITKGKKKGETSNTGVFTKEENKGQARPKYNRTNDTKVILSLTRQMESDLSVQPTEKGYGLGYNNSANADKAKWAEDKYKKKIFALTDPEKEMVIEVANAYTEKTLNG